MARATSRQALALIKGTSQRAEKLRSLVGHLDKGLQKSITENELDDHFLQKFCQSISQNDKVNHGDRKRLSKARVITIKEVIQLKEAREAADADKAVKAAAKEAKVKAKKVQGENPLPKRQGRPKKAVQISYYITIIDLGVGDVTQILEEIDIGEDSEWVHIDDFEDPTPPPARKRSNKAWEKAQNDRYIGNNVHRIYLGELVLSSGCKFHEVGGCHTPATPSVIPVTSGIPV